MDWTLLIILSLPLNIFIIYVMYLDFKDTRETKNSKLDNLNLERIYVNVNEEEKEMLELLARRFNKKEGTFIHSILKNEINRADQG